MAWSAFDESLAAHVSSRPYEARGPAKRQADGGSLVSLAATFAQSSATRHDSTDPNHHLWRRVKAMDSALAVKALCGYAFPVGFPTFTGPSPTHDRSAQSVSNAVAAPSSMFACL